jgi:hypothetical protein
MAVYRLEEDRYEATGVLASQVEDALDAADGGVPVVCHDQPAGAQVFKP